MVAYISSAAITITLPQLREKRYSVTPKSSPLLSFIYSRDVWETGSKFVPDLTRFWLYVGTAHPTGAVYPAQHTYRALQRCREVQCLVVLAIHGFGRLYVGDQQLEGRGVLPLANFFEVKANNKYGRART